MNAALFRDQIKLWLAEDVGSGDHTSLACVPANSQQKAKLLIKDSGILAGIDLALEIFSMVDAGLRVECFLKDGVKIEPGMVAFEVEGNAQSILTAERLVLNCMQHMSAIATTTSKYVELLSGLNCKVLDTRKTTPGCRLMEKWAVKIGGGANHRMALYDMILIKDNHVDYAGGIQSAIEKAKQYIIDKKTNLDIEIEVRSFKELDEALTTGGIQRIMLDNFRVPDLKKAVDIIDGRFETEASGGITLETIRGFAETGVNYVSVGALTHSVKCLDLSLKAIK